MHNRRARPTLRLLREDLIQLWGTPYQRRRLDEGAVDELGPLPELHHAIIAKAVECFGTRAADDHCEGPIRDVTSLELWEIKVQQWRGGVWCDSETGVHWLVAAGLAKGEHRDHDDFYVRLGRMDGTGQLERLLPTAEDTRLLKRETAARIITEWELEIQRWTHTALESTHGGGVCVVRVPHPSRRDSQGQRCHLAELEVEVVQVRDEDYQADEISVRVNLASKRDNPNLWWQAAIRILISILPPEQDWDTDGGSFTTICEPGNLTDRVEELGLLVEQGILGESKPGEHAHFAHREHLAGRTIEGRAVRAMCGTVFVPRQDHEELPTCPRCTEEYAKLPDR